MKNFFVFDELCLGTKALIYIGDLLLICRRDDKAPTAPLLLDLPGGTTENGETPFLTLQRETMEEFGLSVSEKDIVYAEPMKSTFESGKRDWFAVVKLPKSAENEIVFGGEGLEYMLMSEADFIAAKDAWKVYQERARSYITSEA